MTGEGASDALVEYCRVSSTIWGMEDYTGGIAGRNYGTIRECIYEDDIIYGRDLRAGGIVGWNHDGLIKQCSFRGDLDGDTEHGGIVGRIDGGSIEECYAAGTINRICKGGIAGACGGIIGSSFWDTLVTGCSNACCSGSSTIINSHGESTSEMMKKATYTTKHGTNWGFDTTWAIDEDNDYPILRGIGDALSAPNGLTASTGLSDGVNVSWDAVQADTFYEAVYRVYRSDGSGEDAAKQALGGWQSERSFIDESAIPEETYYYSVKAAAAVNGVRESGFSGHAAGQRTYPPTETPSLVVASDGAPHSVLIAWNVVANANYYGVYRSSSVSGPKMQIGSWQTGLSYSDVPPFSDTAYYYWIVAAVSETGDRSSGYGGPDAGYFVFPDVVGPDVSVVMAPGTPIETQAVELHVSAEDDELVEVVNLYWNSGSSDSLAWDGIGTQSFSSSHVIGAFSAGETITFWAEALDATGNRAEGEHILIVVGEEVVSAPNRAVGASILQVDADESFTTGGASSDLGGPFEYLFDWGDSTQSAHWHDGTDAKSWGSDGIYLVRSQARSRDNPERISGLSVALSVVVDSRPPAVVISTNAGVDTTVVDSILTIRGESSDEWPSSGLAATEINTGHGNEGLAHLWSFEVLLSEGTNQIVVTSTDRAGNEGTASMIVTYLAITCQCDCHADPDPHCDGSLNVVDVIWAVDVAFRGGHPILDPNPSCPYEATDVDCNGVTNVVDVVKFVNVAFRGGDPAVEFCDPCAP